jgi:uncharacterized protein (DUF736 family)
MPRQQYLADPEVWVTRTLGEPPAYPLQGRVETSIVRDGTVHGLTVSFSCDLSPHDVLDSRSAPAWQVVFLPIDVPFDVEQDEVMWLDVRLDRPGTEPLFEVQWSGGVVGDEARTFTNHVARG